MRGATDPDEVRSERARRPRYLFSGRLKCGVRDGGYTLVGGRHYGCANVKNRGTCDNRLTVRRDVLEETVLSGLRDNLLHPDLVPGFIVEFQREYNRLRREEEAAETVEPKDEMPRLHPGLAEVYRRKVADPTAALNRDDLRIEATETLRSLIDEIKLIPTDGALMIELVGALAGILALGKEERPRPGGQGRQLTLVAGPATNFIYFSKPNG